MSSSEIMKLWQLLQEARYPVFFGGAGVSTASGIPDFRSSSGVYTRTGVDGPYSISADCLRNDPQRFFDFYRENLMFSGAEPNAIHRTVAALEQQGRIKAVITQNVDGLHQAAGSKEVIELHGTGDRCFCNRCGKLYPGDYLGSSGIPRCEACGGVVRPDVVLFGESLPADAMARAEEEIARADLLIVAGTSLSVYPAASLVADFEGAHLVIINLSPTAYDALAELVIRQDGVTVFEKLTELV